MELCKSCENVITFCEISKPIEQEYSEDVTKTVPCSESFFNPNNNIFLWQTNI